MVRTNKYDIQTSVPVAALRAALCKKIIPNFGRLSKRVLLAFRKKSTRFVHFSMCMACGLVVTVPGYRSRGPGSISGATRFSKK
jgi:hypothetical protein